MARKPAFYSFHFDIDVFRVQQREQRPARFPFRLPLRARAEARPSTWRGRGVIETNMEMACC
jgi:hypothetical protein